MFSHDSLASLAIQMARMVPAPSDLLRRRARLKSRSTDEGCGCCPLCGEFVYVEFLGVEQATLCPRCERPIEDLDALGYVRK